MGRRKNVRRRTAEQFGKVSDDNKRLLAWIWDNYGLLFRTWLTALPVSVRDEVHEEIRQEIPDSFLRANKS